MNLSSRFLSCCVFAINVVRQCTNDSIAYAALLLFAAYNWLVIINYYQIVNVRSWLQAFTHTRTMYIDRMKVFTSATLNISNSLINIDIMNPATLRMPALRKLCEHHRRILIFVRYLLEILCWDCAYQLLAFLASLKCWWRFAWSHCPMNQFHKLILFIWCVSVV